MTHNTTKIVMIVMVLSYVIIASIGCSPMGYLTCEILDTVGIDSQIAIANVDGKESYSHVYVMIGGKPYEPRYLGLYLQDNIDYNNPYGVYDSGDDYKDAYDTIFPDVATIIDAIKEI